VKHDGDKAIIEEIKMDKVTCYKNLLHLKRIKELILFYGLSGTGESVFSHYPKKIKNLS
jgi:hypothetical protein